MRPRRITVTLELKPEFLSDVIINASETAYSWFAFDLRRRTFREIATGKDLSNVEALAPHRSLDASICLCCPLKYDRLTDDEGSLKGRFTLNHAAVAEGLRRIISGAVTCGMAGEIGAAVAAQDAGCLDANLCDLIVQAAIFDEIVYG